MILRQLLYHRGLDNAYSTYVTDYINGILFIIYAGIFVVLAIRDKMQRRPKLEEQTEEDVIKQYRDALTSLNNVVVIFFVSGAAMNILGGYAHHYVEVLDDVYDSVQFPQTTYSLTEMRDLVAKTITSLETLQPWYVVWEAANFSGSLMASCLMLSISYLLATEVNRVRGQSMKSVGHETKMAVVSTQERTFQASTKKKTSSHCKVVFIRFLQVVAIMFVFLAIGNHLLNLYLYKENIQSDTDILETLNTIGSIEDDKVLISDEPNLEKHQLAFSNFEHLNIKKLWTSGLTVVTLYTSVLLYTIFSTFFAVKEMIKYFQIDVKKKKLKTCALIHREESSLAVTSTKSSDDVRFRSCRNRMNNNLGSDRNIVNGERKLSSAVEITANCAIDVQFSASRLKNFCEHLCQVSTLTIWSLRCIGGWSILTGGSVQVALTPKCSSANAFAMLGCPLPDSFNHNSVYHVALGLGMTFIFLAEILRYFGRFGVDVKAKE